MAVCLLLLVLASFGFATRARADEGAELVSDDGALAVEPLDQAVLDESGFDVGEASEVVGSAAEPTDGVSAMAEGEINTFVFKGTKDYALANEFAKKATEGNNGLKVDAGLTEAAMQRAAEISVYFEDTQTGSGHQQHRPDGSDYSTAYKNSHADESAGLACELIYLGPNANGTTAYNALKAVNGSNGKAALTDESYRSIGVGCYYQGTGHFFVVLLGTKDGSGTPPTARQANQTLKVDVNMENTELATRVRADFEDPLLRKKGSYRDTRLYWVTAQNVQGYPTMPAMLIDPSTFTWTSTNNGVASVTTAGRVTINAESTPTTTRTATIRAQVTQGNRYLSFSAVAAVPVYRLYNPNSGEHFYTESTGERDHLRRVGWRYEGLAWYNAPKGGYGTPVYRVYNPNAGDHHYTTSKGERDNLVRLGWRGEGIGWYTADIDGTIIYRAYNPNAKAGAHHWTTSKGEYDKIVRLGWRGEGIGFYSVP